MVVIFRLVQITTNILLRFPIYYFFSMYCFFCNKNFDITNMDISILNSHAACKGHEDVAVSRTPRELLHSSSLNKNIELMSLSNPYTNREVNSLIQNIIIPASATHN